MSSERDESEGCNAHLGVVYAGCHLHKGATRPGRRLESISVHAAGSRAFPVRMLLEHGNTAPKTFSSMLAGRRHER